MCHITRKQLVCARFNWLPAPQAPPCTKTVTTSPTICLPKKVARSLFKSELQDTASERSKHPRWFSFFCTRSRSRAFAYFRTIPAEGCAGRNRKQTPRVLHLNRADPCRRSRADQKSKKNFEFPNVCPRCLCCRCNCRAGTLGRAQCRAGT